MFWKEKEEEKNQNDHPVGVTADISVVSKTAREYGPGLKLERMTMAQRRFVAPQTFRRDELGIVACVESEDPTLEEI